MTRSPRLLNTFPGTFALASLCLLAMSAATRAADDKPVVIMETSVGPVTIELDPKSAPITVDNFLKYVDEGYYNNLVFHRVIDGFMVQGGGMDDRLNEKGKQRPPIRNESTNGLKNKRGTIAMARTSDPDSATSQFYINLVDNRALDGIPGAPGYAVFGKVTDGMAAIDAIAKTRTKAQDVPVKPIYIKSVKRK